jgi:hypothetical protein
MDAAIGSASTMAHRALCCECAMGPTATRGPTPLTPLTPHGRSSIGGGGAASRRMGGRNGDDGGGVAVGGGEMGVEGEGAAGDGDDWCG